MFVKRVIFVLIKLATTYLIKFYSYCISFIFGKFQLESIDTIRPVGIDEYKTTMIVKVTH